MIILMMILANTGRFLFLFIPLLSHSVSRPHGNLYASEIPELCRWTRTRNDETGQWNFRWDLAQANRNMRTWFEIQLSISLSWDHLCERSAKLVLRGRTCHATIYPDHSLSTPFVSYGCVFFLALRLRIHGGPPPPPSLDACVKKPFSTQSWNRRVEMGLLLEARVWRPSLVMSQISPCSA